MSIYKSLEFIEDPPEAKEDKDDVSTIIKIFDANIIGEVYETWEAYVFNSRNQKSGTRENHLNR